MSYLTIKWIKGNPYLYQVRSERRGDRVVQVFERYLGRAETADREIREIVEPKTRTPKVATPSAIEEPIPEAVTPPVEVPEVAPEITPEVEPELTPVEEAQKGVFWHGSPSGELIGGASGLHIGTEEAAKQALEARIGIPAEGSWDGTRKYGKTLLAGKKTLKKLDPRGFNVTGYNVDAPAEDYYPTGGAKFADSSAVSLLSKPDLFQVKITGAMTNTPPNCL